MILFPNKQRAVLLWLTLLVCVAFSIPRFCQLDFGLPHYRIDENDIVLPAVSFLTGDIRYENPRYGPVTMYLLAAVYAVQASWEGSPLWNFGRNVFFQPADFYLTARVLNGVLVTIFVVLCFIFSHRRFGWRVACFSAILSSLPLVDSMAHYNLRVDTVLALLQGLALYFAIQFYGKNTPRCFVVLAILCGLAIACKPLPGLLILPTVWLASWLSKRNTKRWFLQQGVFIALILGSAALVYPRFIYDLPGFFQDQWPVIHKEFANAWPRGYRLDRFLDVFGLPLSLLFGLSLVFGLLSRDRRVNLIATFPLTFILAFAFVPSRMHYYIPIVPPLCLLSGIWLSRCSEKIASREKQLAFLSVGLLSLAWFPVQKAWERVGISGRIPTTLLAEKWIEENVPKGEAIALFGRYTSGPRIVASRPDIEAKFGEYFWFHLSKNAKLATQFFEAHRSVVNSTRPTYRIHHWRDRPGINMAPAVKRLLYQELYAFCRTHQIEYVVLSGGALHDSIASSWKGAFYRVVYFGKQSKEISIFKLDS